MAYCRNCVCSIFCDQSVLIHLLLWKKEKHKRQEEKDDATEQLKIASVNDMCVF